ncbi:unnamed protein product [Musa acuminata subsp. burmannicoides]
MYSVIASIIIPNPLTNPHLLFPLSIRRRRTGGSRNSGFMPKATYSATTPLFPRLYLQPMVPYVAHPTPPLPHHQYFPHPPLPAAQHVRRPAPHQHCLPPNP